jgi:hypothetical protein
MTVIEVTVGLSGLSEVPPLHEESSMHAMTLVMLRAENT